MARENKNILEKAKRLVELCRECSRDNKRKAPVWLSHVRLGCGLESEYPLNKMLQGGEFQVVYPTNDVFVNRLYCIEDGDIVDSVKECLEDYSELIVEETIYDDMEHWLRGFMLLALHCSNKREVYWLVEFENKQQFPSHCTFDNMEFLRKQKEDPFYPKFEFVRDCEDSGISHIGISSIPDSVYNAWIDDPDNRWVIRWKNIFRDIESESQVIVDYALPKKKIHKRTRTQILIDESTINNYCFMHPCCTREEIHEATGISAPTISRTTAWELHKKRRESVRKANRAISIDNMDQFDS